MPTIPPDRPKILSPYTVFLVPSHPKSFESGLVLIEYIFRAMWLSTMVNEGVRFL